MREPILMPTLSDTMETGHFVDWLKQPGDEIKKGDAIAEVETDKAIMEVEAFHDGYLAGPLAQADTDISTGEVIGYIVDAPQNEQPQAAPAHQKTEKRSAKSKPASKTVTHTEQPSALKSSKTKLATSTNIPASPYARGLARELGINLASVTPAADGSIRASQVMAAALGRVAPNLDDGPGYKLVAPTPAQRAIANNMVAASSTPTFRVSARLPLAPLLALAQEVGCSLTLLLARACALTVEAHPKFNSVFTSNGIAQRQQVDVGIAVDVPDGLVTPVLRDVTRRPLNELSNDWNILKKKATGKQAGQYLKPKDYRGATFYLSNLGMFPTVSNFDAVVPIGAAAIMAVAASHDGVAEFTLNCDHRVVYGADAARFLDTFANLIGDAGSTRLVG